MRLKYYFLIVVISFSKLKANPAVVCTHPEVCHMAQLVLADSNSIHFQMVPKYTGDMHSFDLDSQSMKIMLKSEKLILPPLSQWPHGRNIELKRTSQNTLRLTSPPPPHTYRAQMSNVAWEHFWLNPLTYCQVFHQLAEGLRTWYPQLQSRILRDCPLRLTSTIEQIGSQKDTRFFILTHDSLIPLMVALKKRYFTLKTSYQRETISSQSLKQLLREFRKHKKIVWLQEKHLPFPRQLQSHTQRANSRVIKIETLRPFPSDGPNYVPLDSILKALTETP